MLDHIKNFFYDIYDRLADLFHNIMANHDNGYLIAIGLLLVVLLGFILDWEWIVRPNTSKYFVNWLYSLGRTVYRIVMSLIVLIAILILIFIYYHANRG